MDLFELKIRSNFKAWTLNFRSGLITNQSRSWLRHVLKRESSREGQGTGKVRSKTKAVGLLKRDIQIHSVHPFTFCLSSHLNIHLAQHLPFNILETRTEAVKTEDTAKQFWPLPGKQGLLVFCCLFESLMI